MNCELTVLVALFAGERSAMMCVAAEAPAWCSQLAKPKLEQELPETA
jgi:hypothetical protein